LRPVYTAKTRDQKQNQHKFFFWYKRENRDWIKNQLGKAKRPDLIEKLLGKNAVESKPKIENIVEKTLPPWLEKRRNQNKTKKR
jgi:hypothetical protein